jgi:hypothetical protein
VVLVVFVGVDSAAAIVGGCVAVFIVVVVDVAVVVDDTAVG